jgi:hypothetical protein
MRQIDYERSGQSHGHPVKCTTPLRPSPDGQTFRSSNPADVRLAPVSWGARACKRFVVSIPSEGWLHGFLHWDTTAQGFDVNLIGEVVLVQRSGRFATSEWHQVDAHVFDLLVLSYSDDVRLPFQLRTELRGE